MGRVLEKRLIYSEDDGGWYWEREDWAVSKKVYPSERAARRALKEGKVEWEK